MELAWRALFKAKTHSLHMNLFNALGFFILGLAMMVLPELVPALVPNNIAFGDVAGLWLEFMGGIIFLIGSGYTAKGLAAALPRSTVSENAPASSPVRARERAALSVDGSEARV